MSFDWTCSGGPAGYAAISDSPANERRHRLYRPRGNGHREVTGEHNRARDIGGLTGRQVERQRSAMLIAYGVDLGVAASLGAADGL